MARVVPKKENTQKYYGSCHCGEVEFSINAEIQELTTCDCSLCVKKNALMTKVHESQFTLIAGQKMLAEYQWNMKIARHFFCKKCGIYTFHRKRAQPDHFGINVHCLQDINLSGISVTQTDGRSMSLSPEVERNDQRASNP